MPASQYQFDPTGLSPDNHVANELHQLTNSTARAFTVEGGTFYTTHTVVRMAATGTILTTVQYQFIGFDPEMTALTGLSVAAGIAITDEVISGDVIVTTQLVGGTEGINSSLVLELNAKLDSIGNTSVPWGKLLDVPEFFPPIPNHPHSITDLTELDRIRNALEAMTDSLTSNRVIPDSLGTLNNKIDRTLALIAIQRNDINLLGLLANRLRTIESQYDDYNATQVALDAAFSYIDPNGTVDLTALTALAQGNETGLVDANGLIGELTTTLTDLVATVEALGVTALSEQLSTLQSSFDQTQSPNVSTVIHPTHTPVSTHTYLKGTVFQSSHGETQQARRWMIATDAAFTDVIYQRTIVDTSDTHTIDIVLDLDTEYWVRAAVEGSITGWSDWSPPWRFQTIRTLDSITAVGDQTPNGYRDVVRTNDGGMLAVGQSSNLGVDKGLITQFTVGGTEIHSVVVGGVGTDRLNSASVISDIRMVAVGHTLSFGALNSNGYVLLMTESLAVLKQKVIGGNYTVEFNDSVVFEDRVYVVGTAVDPGTGITHGIVTILNTDLSVLSVRLYSNGVYDSFSCITVGVNGTLVVGGTTRTVIGGLVAASIVTISESGSVSAAVRFTHSDALDITDVTWNGTRYLLVGSVVDSGTTSGLLLQLDPALNILQQRRVQGGISVAFTGASITDNGYNVVGRSQNMGVGGGDAIVTKLDDDLLLESMQVLGGIGWDEFTGLASHGGITTIAGTTESYGAGGLDGMLVSVNSTLAVTNGTIPDLSSMSWSTPRLSLDNLNLLVTAYVPSLTTPLIPVTTPGGGSILSDLISTTRNF